jgi:hypothetical protein
MYRRMLFIGLGGSGGKTLRCLKRDLRDWLDDQGWAGPFPSGWQFVHIDTPPVPDGLRPGGGSLDDTEYLGLVGAGTQFSAISNVVGAIPEINNELMGWRVDPAALSVPVTMGAGQFRAIGRTIAMGYANAIKSRLAQSIASLNNPGSAAELNALYAQATNSPAPSSAAVPPIAVVVSSLAGGTGAGLLIDVCDTLRALEPSWGSESIALLYTPEVFLGLGNAAVGGVQPNSLAAISEVLNGYWWHGGVQKTQVPYKDLAALKNAALGSDIPQSGPFCPYLIGSTGANGVQFSSDNQLFETVGGALVSWATDPQVQQGFVAHSIGNWKNAAVVNQVKEDVLVNSGLSPGEPGVPAFSALGFSRVSLGTKYFQKYASRRLARDAAFHLAQAHQTSAEAQSLIQNQKMIDPDQLTNELASRYMSWFITSAKLDEKGPDKNDISDALRPDDWWTQFDMKVSMALNLADRTGSASAGSWIQDLEPAIDQSTRAFKDALEPIIHANVLSWIKTQPGLLLKTTENAIARFGLKVTGRILSGVADYLDNPADGVVAELRGDGELGRYIYFAQPSEWKGQLRVHLDESSKAKIQNDHPSIRESVVEALKYSTCISNADVCERAADLLEDFAANFVRPLARAVNESASKLENSLNGILDWPTWAPGPPPLDITPPKSEWTLIEAEEFNEIFLNTLAETFSGSGVSGRDDQQRLARDEVVSGEFIRSLMESAPAAAAELKKFLLLGVNQEWKADFRITHEPEPARPATFDIRANPDDIAARAEAWMIQKGTPFELLLHSTLRSYTAHEAGQIQTATSTEYDKRQKRFIQKFQSAIASAAPLVGINPSLVGLLHPNSADGSTIKVNRDVSQIPFLNHPLDAMIRTELEKSVYAGARSGRIASVMVNDTHLPHIDIISQLDAPISPLVVESLMKPIANAWASSKSSQVSRAGFWSLRRARILKEFIPVPQEHLRAMIRGWFTAQLLGLIDISKAPYVIYKNPMGPIPDEMASFPDEFLSSSANPKDQLPIVLESLSLAYAEVGNQSSLNPLHAFIALRDYGRTNPQLDPKILEYSACNPVIKHWIDTGSIPNQDRLNQYKGARHEIQGGTAPERIVKTVKFIETIASDYSNLWESHIPQIAANPSKMSSAPFWPELYGDIQAALLELRSAISALASDSGATDL